MTLATVEGGTRLTHRSEGLKHSGWFRAVQPLVFPLVGEKSSTTGLNSIKARVEAGARRLEPSRP